MPVQDVTSKCFPPGGPLETSRLSGAHSSFSTSSANQRLPAPCLAACPHLLRYTCVFCLHSVSSLPCENTSCQQQKKRTLFSSSFPPLTASPSSIGRPGLPTTIPCTMASQFQRASIRSIQPLPVVLEDDVDGNANAPMLPVPAHSPRRKRRSGLMSEMLSAPSKPRQGSAGTGKTMSYSSNHTNGRPRGTAVHPAYARRFGLLEELYSEKSAESDGKLEAQPLPESDPSDTSWLSRGSWTRLVLMLLLLATIAVGLGVGLGIGLRKKAYVLENWPLLKFLAALTLLAETSSSATTLATRRRATYSQYHGHITSFEQPRLEAIPPNPGQPALVCQTAGRHA